MAYERTYEEIASDAFQRGLGFAVLLSVLGGVLFLFRHLGRRSKRRAVQDFEATRPTSAPEPADPKPSLSPGGTERDSSGPRLPMSNTVGPRDAITPSDDDWAAAMVEFDGPGRRAGTWARCFALSNGNETEAKAAYLRDRALQIAEARAAQPKAPPTATERREDAVRLFVRGGRITPADVVELLAAAKENPAVLKLAQDNSGDSLLHQFARLDLAVECRTLLSLGADPCAKNTKAMWPSMVGTGHEVRQVLQDAAKRASR